MLELARTDGQTDRTTTVTLTAHARRGLIVHCGLNSRNPLSYTDLGVNYTSVIAIARLTFDLGDFSTTVAAVRTTEERCRLVEDRRGKYSSRGTPKAMSWIAAS